MQIETLSTNFAVVNPTVMTDTSFPARVPTTTKPVESDTGGVVDFGGDDGGGASNAVRFLIADDGANDAVLTGLRVFGWGKVKKGTPTQSDLWVPVLLLEVAAVLGNIPGIANTQVDETFFFADTITLITGNANISNEILSPVADEIAHVVLDVKGFEKVEFTVDLGANATGTKILYAKL